MPLEGTLRLARHFSLRLLMDLGPINAPRQKPGTLTRHVPKDSVTPWQDDFEPSVLTMKHLKPCLYHTHTDVDDVHGPDGSPAKL